MSEPATMGRQAYRRLRVIVGFPELRAHATSHPRWWLDGKAVTAVVVAIVAATAVLLTVVGHQQLMAAADVGLGSGIEAARAADATGAAVSAHPPSPTCPTASRSSTVAVGRRVSFGHLSLRVEHILLVVAHALANLAGEQSPEGVVEVPVKVVV
ncbi:hypothetical protein ElyMa_006358500 [Elysia marginata]|uniref:Uncharacterized protein n=1 Tax=Elysia marginata TaxID=1093978 RepID=A0AAV4HLN5_9GAST|nr:hypothetical protein ElyMa_006358500 [Elysia marginata]